MDIINKILSFNWVEKVIKIGFCIGISLIIYYLINDVIDRYSNSNRFNKINNKKIKTTYFNLIKNISKYIIIVICILIIFKILNIDITSIVAGVGVMGAAVVFALQDFLKDLVRGSSIISGDYFKIGDVVKYKDIEGKVVLLSLKTTKIEVLSTGNIMSIANRNIDEIELVSNYIYIDIPLPYELKVKDAEKVLDKAIKRINKLELVKDSKYMGTSKLGESSILYKIRVECSPKNKLQTDRDTIREILLVLEENNISVPYNQLDIHQK